METLDQLAKKAIGLRPVERIRLVEAILYGSLNLKLDTRHINEESSSRMIGMK